MNLQPITAANAKDVLRVNVMWREAIRRESARGARVSAWLIAAVSSRIAMAEAVIAAQQSQPAPDDLLSQGKAA